MTAVVDYLSLAKPRTVLLHLVTAACAMFLAAGGWPPAVKFALTLIGGRLVAAAANAFNCYLDRDLDRWMPRTRQRPLPSGRLRPGRALLFGILLGFIGSFLLVYFVSLPVAVIALLAGLLYVLVYTLWLKRRTYWSAIIGSAAGAFPPVIGWIAIKGGLGLTPFILAAIIVLWTPVHFWSLAVYYRRDYDGASIIVMPQRHVAGWLIIFAVLLTGTTLLLIPVAHLAWVYTTVALLLGLSLIYLTLNLQLDSGHQKARRLFLFSIWYLVLLSAAMVVDTLV